MCMLLLLLGHTGTQSLSCSRTSRAQIMLAGEAGTSDPDLQPGDIVFVVDIKPHESFKRVGHDLVYQKNITLVEALTGCEFSIKHLDDRVLHVKMPQGHIIKPDSWIRVDEEGMPMQGQPFNKGNLYVEFVVDFPESLDDAAVAQLRAALPPAASNGHMEADDEESEDVKATPIEDMKAELQHRAELLRKSNSTAYDSDSEDEMRAGGLRCAHQ